jgi:hypothetical protein
MYGRVIVAFSSEVRKYKALGVDRDATCTVSGSSGMSPKHIYGLCAMVTLYTWHFGVCDQGGGRMAA